MDVLSSSYAERLERHQRAAWKRMFDVQAPYRWNLRRLNPGKTLDIGCGLGRNLRHLNGRGVGVDPNAECVAFARASGFEAYTPEELPDYTFDTLLFSHVLEHVAEPAELVLAYLPWLKSDGRVIIMTPQELGYASDPTHVVFLDFDALAGVVETVNLTVERAYSFPFPRWAGRLFKYNEFVLVTRRA